jgi:iron complex transport system ATP-binding protein
VGVSISGESAPLELRGAGLGSGSDVRLHPTDLLFESGTVTSIIGPNGSGKSTLLGLMSGDGQPTSGLVLMYGHESATINATMLARHRSLLAQETNVSFPFLVHEVVAWGRLAWRRTPSAGDDARIIDAAIESQGLAALRDRRVTELSGGERTRVHLARVIAQQTPLLLLDEADADLDLVGRSHLDATVAALAKEGSTVVLVSHDINRVAALSHRMIIMSAGIVRADGPPRKALTTDNLSTAFGTTVEVSDEDGNPVVRLPATTRRGQMPG